MSGSNTPVDIQFSVYPASNRVPGSFAEVNNSNANTAQQNQRALIIGQKTAAGTAAVNTAIIDSGAGNAAAAFGANSMIAQALQTYRASDTFGEVWLLPLADDPDGIKASGTINPAGPATAAGNIFLYIAQSVINPRYVVPVSAGMTAVQIGAAIAAGINAVTTGPVTAVADSETGDVTVTAVNAGMVGNSIGMYLNFAGAVQGEVLPAGVGITFTGTVSGTGTYLQGGEVNPVLTAALANLSGDQTFDFILCPYQDAISRAAITALLNDQTGRWSWQQELFGGAWSVYRGSLGQLAAAGNAENDQHTQAMGVFDSPSPDHVWAADVMANAAVSLRANPAVPLQYLPLAVVTAPPLASRFTPGERNTLLYDGVSTFLVTDAGQVQIERMCTTYQINAAGAPDNSYLDTETLYTLQYIIRDYRTFFLSTFPRKILVADGTPIPYGSSMVTSQTILAAAIARYQTYCAAGLAQNAAQFAKQAQAQNAGNGLVKLLLPLQVADQLRQTALLVQFTKP